MRQYKVVTISHKTTKVNKLKDYLLTNEDTTDFPIIKLEELKNKFGIHELLYLNTCNRVTFFFTYDQHVDTAFLSDLFLLINPNFTKELIHLHVNKALVFEGEDAIKHFFSVAASMDSLVIGEREILGQIKNAYAGCKQYNLCGDKIRLAVEQAIVFAKSIHSETKIGEKPVSVVSLAFRTLLEKNITKDSNLLIIGAGQTNNLMANLLVKFGMTNVSVYNRTLSKAEDLAARFLSKKAYTLDKLINHSEPVDVILTCTGAHFPVLTHETLQKINPEQRPLIIVDLAVPADAEAKIIEQKNIQYIDVASLEKKANENMQIRKKELYKAEGMLEVFMNNFNELFKERSLELALANIPGEVKNIKERALYQAFKKDVESLDSNAKEVLEKVMAYVEEKYIALPFKASKKVLLEKSFRP